MPVSRYAIVVYLGLTWSFQASAAITQISGVNVSGTGGYDVWSDVANNNVLVNIGDIATGTATSPLDQYLTGNATLPPGPGDNIELGNDRSYADWSAGSSSTLTGMVGSGISVELRTPSLADWSDGPNPSSLAYAYATAALASLGKNPDIDWIELGGVTFKDAVTEFVFGFTTPGTSGAYAISDSNISYIYSDSPVKHEEVYIGLAGNLDAQFLSPLLPFVGITPGSVQVQASEVVFVNLTQLGSTVYSGFKYSFDATATDQAAQGGGPTICDSWTGTGTPDPICSYTGNYEVVVPVPIPAPAALLAFGLLGLTFARRSKV